MWIYRPSAKQEEGEPATFSVGYFNTFGDYEAMCDGHTELSAMQLVNSLNGGKAPTLAMLAPTAEPPS